LSDFVAVLHIWHCTFFATTGHSSILSHFLCYNTQDASNRTVTCFWQPTFS